MMDATMKENPDDPPQELSTHYACGECNYMGRKRTFLRKHQMEVGHAGLKMVLEAKHPKVPDQVEDPAGLAPDPDGQLQEPVDEPFATTFDEPASHDKKKKKKNKTKSDPEPAEKPSGLVPRRKYQCKVCDKRKKE